MRKTVIVVFALVVLVCGLSLLFTKPSITVVKREPKRKSPVKQQHQIQTPPFKTKKPSRQDVSGTKKKCVLFGFVTGGGEPVSHAVVSFHRKFTRTDKRGYYEMEVLAGKGGLLVVRAEGWAQTEVKLERLLPGRQRVDVEMSVGATIVGRVVDESGVPVEGAEVLVQYHTHPGSSIVRVKTAKDGSFRLVHVPIQGRFVTVAAFKNGYLPAQRHVIPEEGKETDAGELVLLRGALIEGVVVNSKGLPIKGVKVEATHSAGISWSLTDKEGFFRITGLPEGEEMTLTCAPKGFVHTRRRVRAGERGIRLLLKRTASLEGRITNPPKEGLLTVRLKYANITHIRRLTKNASFKIEPVYPGKAWLEVLLNGRCVLRRNIIIKEGENISLNLTIPYK